MSKDIKELRRYMDVRFQQLEDKFDMLLEIVIGMRDTLNKVPSLETDVATTKLSQDVHATSLKEHSRDLTAHEKRISRLEDVVYSTS